MKCDCARGHLGEHRPACPEFPPEAVAARVASQMSSKSPERLAVDICKQRVDEKKQWLDNALAEYAMACQTLALAVERADRASELPTEPQHEKPDQQGEG